MDKENNTGIAIKPKFKSVIDQTIEIQTNTECPLIERIEHPKEGPFLHCQLANAFCKHDPSSSNPCPLDENGVVVVLIIYKKVPG